jgi:hypothetical protein
MLTIRKAQSCEVNRTEQTVIDGVVVVGDAATSVVVVTDLTDDLKSYIRDHLSHLCYGANFVDGSPDYYSFSRTVGEFLERFDKKPDTTKVGMIGELLTHLLAPEIYPDLDTVSLFFNKEERSIKKGFDLTFYSDDETGVWYAEVKSGHVQSGHPADKVIQLLRTAASDLRDKLAAPTRRSLWDAAQIDALAVLGAESSNVRQVLQQDEQAAVGGAAWNRLGVLVAAVFHPISIAAIEHADLLLRLGTDSFDPSFDGLRLMAIQKSTLDKVVEFLREESA